MKARNVLHLQQSCIPYAIFNKDDKANGGGKTGGQSTTVNGPISKPAKSALRYGIEQGLTGAAQQDVPDPGQLFGGIHFHGIMKGFHDPNPIAEFQGAQLLQ